MDAHRKTSMQATPQRTPAKEEANGNGTNKVQGTNPCAKSTNMKYVEEIFCSDDTVMLAVESIIDKTIECLVESSFRPRITCFAANSIMSMVWESVAAVTLCTCETDPVMKAIQSFEGIKLNTKHSNYIIKTIGQSRPSPLPTTNDRSIPFQIPMVGLSYPNKVTPKLFRVESNTTPSQKNTDCTKSPRVTMPDKGIFNKRRSTKLSNASLADQLGAKLFHNHRSIQMAASIHSSFNIDNAFSDPLDITSNSILHNCGETSDDECTDSSECKKTLNLRNTCNVVQTTIRKTAKQVVQNAEADPLSSGDVNQNKESDSNIWNLEYLSAFLDEEVAGTPQKQATKTKKYHSSSVNCKSGGPVCVVYTDRSVKISLHPSTPPSMVASAGSTASRRRRVSAASSSSLHTAAERDTIFRNSTLFVTQSQDIPSSDCYVSDRIQEGQEVVTSMALSPGVKLQHTANTSSRLGKSFPHNRNHMCKSVFQNDEDVLALISTECLAANKPKQFQKLATIPSHPSNLKSELYSCIPGQTRPSTTPTAYRKARNSSQTLLEVMKKRACSRRPSLWAISNSVPNKMQTKPIAASRRQTLCTSPLAKRKLTQPAT